jgi:membrane protein
MARRTRTPWPEHPRVRTARDRWPLVDIVVGTLDGYRRHRTNRNAAVVAYFGFISVFPLFIVFTTVLGILLRNRPEWQESIVDSALANLPFIGQQLSTDPASLGGSPWVVVVGLLTALWAGLKAFVAIHGGLDDTAEIDVDARANGAVQRAHSLVGIIIIAIGLVTTTVFTSLVATESLPRLSWLAAVVVSLVVNSGIIAFTYQWLCSERRPLRRVWRGAALAGSGFAILQLLSTTLVARSLSNASSVYGSFATVIALLLWMSLHANAAFLGDELNRYVERRDNREITASTAA